jgi:glycosyltransferase involved in cell wall biosynthesis
MPCSRPEGKETAKMERCPLVSVYTGTFNAGTFIAEAFKSLLDQTHPNWEWVVVDDGSEDATWSLLCEFARSDPRVRVHRQLHCGKVGAVKDAATRLARGKYLVELDHDDMLTENALAEIVAAFEADPKAGMVYANCAEFNPDGSAHKYPGAFWADRYRPFKHGGKEYQECLTPDVYGTSDGWPRAWFLTVGPNHPRAFRAETLRALGGYDYTLALADDFDLTARMFLRSKIVRVEKCLYLYRWREGARGENATKLRNAEIQVQLEVCRNRYRAEFEAIKARTPTPCQAERLCKGLKVLAMAKNEAAALPGFVKQFRGITDRFCFMVDSASDDGTAGLAIKLGGAVKTRAFTRFDEQRNAMLKAMGAGAEWIIPLDPDERLDARTISLIPELMKRKDVDFYFARLWARNRDGTEREWPGKPFLVRKVPGLRWIGAVHENLIGSHRCVQVTNARITHDISLHSEERRNKADALYTRLSELPRLDAGGFPCLGYGKAEDPAIRKVWAGPLVSVIIPTFKRPKLLVKAIESVLAQDYFPLEIIIVGDHCPALKKLRLPRGDMRVVVENLARNHKDWGGAARNRGIELARGDWIAYLDDDNEWEPNHLSSLMFPAEWYGADYAVASLKIGDKVLRCSKPEKGRVDASAILHRKALVAKFGKWREGAAAVYANDWAFVEPWVKSGGGWACSNKPTVKYNLETCGQREFIEAQVAAGG